MFHKHEALEQQEPVKKRDKKMQQVSLDLLSFYSVAHRRVAMEIDPQASAFRGQITFELDLREDIPHPATG